ncbi:hypothetical protein ACQUJO_23935 [Ralstonia pseudosolanacearum]
MTDHDDQLRNSTPATDDHQRDELHQTTDAWLRHAIDGIRLMHLDENVRREVAKRLF